MYVARVPNRGSPPAILLRESYREDGKVKNRTLANLSRWPEDKVDALARVLKGLSAQVELAGRLVSEAVPVQFGGASWAEVLSRRLRISQSEAQRRIAEATYGAVPAVDRSSTPQSEPRPRG